MHPLIRILCLLAFAVGVADAAPTALLLASLALAALLAVTGTGSGVLAVLGKLRWLFLSVLIAYAWLMPGQPLFAALGDWSPSTEGLIAGTSRAWMLLVLAVAARLIVSLTARGELIAALYDLMKPLRLSGWDPTRFCIRLVLTLEYALREGRGGSKAEGKGRGGLIARAGTMAAGKFDEAVARADRQPETMIEIPRLGAPTPWQWLVPVIVGAVLMMAGRGS